MGDYALYRMERNVYLGECLAIVCGVTHNEMQEDSLQNPNILLLIKSSNLITEIGTIEQLNEIKIFSNDRKPLLRIASECLPGIFGDSHCDCESQRIATLRKIASYGQGLFVYIPQEGQGNGLFYKAQELNLQVNGISPEGKNVGAMSVDDAAKFLLGEEQILDKRNYTSLHRIFTETGLNRYEYELITESPQKKSFLSDNIGIKIVGTQSVKRIINIDNAGEFLAKLYKKGYRISDQELEEIYLCLFSAAIIPPRILGLLRNMSEDMEHGHPFDCNEELIKKTIQIVLKKPSQEFNYDISNLSNVSSYEEYQVELKISTEATIKLFQEKVLGGIDNIRYEVNHFYDVVSFEGVPTRTLKIRHAYKISDPNNPIEIKFIYKVPIGNKLYRIRSLPIKYDDISKILGFVLRDYEQHIVPVFTHSVVAGGTDMVVLVKRYSKNLRTLSLMGTKDEVIKFMEIVKKSVEAEEMTKFEQPLNSFYIEEIPDPSNALFLNRKLSLDFDYDSLSIEETSLFREFFVP